MARMKFVWAILGAILLGIRLVFNISEQAESLQEYLRIPPEFWPVGEGEQNALESILIKKFGCFRIRFGSGVTDNFLLPTVFNSNNSS